VPALGWKTTKQHGVTFHKTMIKDLWLIAIKSRDNDSQAYFPEAVKEMPLNDVLKLFSIPT
jgi:hypothetical protein